MFCGKHFYAWPDPDIIADTNSASCMEKTNLTNPRVVADNHVALEITPENCIMSDIDIIADFKVFRVEDAHAVFNNDVFTDLAPVMAAQFKQVGFDASFRMTSDVFSRMAQGVARSFLMGNGGSVRDPYFTMRLYHSRFVQPTGTHAERFWRWSNPEYDALVDQMGQTAPDDPELQRLFREAMEIWLSELPSIPIVQWYHRIPHNETYWKNWPTAKNPYINSAYWHNTWLLVLLGLEPAQG